MASDKNYDALREKAERFRGHGRHMMAIDPSTVIELLDCLATIEQERLDAKIDAWLSLMEPMTVEQARWYKEQVIACACAGSPFPEGGPCYCELRTMQVERALS